MFRLGHPLSFWSSPSNTCRSSMLLLLLINEIDETSFLYFFSIEMCFQVRYSKLITFGILTLKSYVRNS